jgi:hypothetical protein
MILRIARNTQRFRLFLEIHISSYRWSNAMYHEMVEEQVNLNLPICIRETAVSMYDCARVDFIFPVDDRPAALILLEDRIREKLALPEVHKAHRFCPVRVEQDKLAEGFGVARRELPELIEVVNPAQAASIEQ